MPQMQRKANSLLSLCPLAAPLINQVGDQPAPTCLMARTQALAGFAMIILVEQQVIAPVGVSLKLLIVAKTGTPPGAIASEDADHPIGDLFRHLAGGHCTVVTACCYGELGAQGITETQQ